MEKQTVVYVTKSSFKEEENRIFRAKAVLQDGSRVADLFAFEIRNVPIKEILEVDLQVMVQDEVVKAYSELRVPCIVEHAGLIFDEFSAHSYPGGLTKPMWDTLGDKFLEETHSAGRKATARAVVAYCDGKGVRTFVGETQGRLADSVRGNREFYWDTVFEPSDATGAANGKTYAEIVDDPSLGLEYKVLRLSQSTRAMLNLLEYLRTKGEPDLWS